MTKRLHLQMESLKLTRESLKCGTFIESTLSLQNYQSVIIFCQGAQLLKKGLINAARTMQISGEALNGWRHW